MDIKEPCIICSIDKDLLQVAGEHYNFVTGNFSTISPRQGMLNFYYQMIMGDSSDNIFGFDGKARQKVPKFLEPTISLLMECKDDYEMDEYVFDLYGDRQNQYEMNAHCLWIQRQQGEQWQRPKPHDSNQA